MRGNDSAQGVDSGCRKSTPFPKYATFNGRLVILGFGSIGQGSLPLVLRHLDMEGKQVTILVPRDCPTSQAAERIAPEYGVNIVFARLTPDNYIDILTPLLAKGDFLLNVSVDVSSLDLIRFCNPRGVFYIDTCVEPWAGGYSSSDVSLADRSNYALREQALALKRQLASPTSTTAISCLGANPGLVSLFVKQALLNIAADTGVKMAERPRSRVAWAKLAQQLGIKAIHIAERDTQYCLQRKKKGEFVNTWSVDGFISEGCFQPSELGWGTHEKQLPVGGHHHTSGCGSAIYIDKPGSLVQVRTWTPLEGAFHGFLVTHNEAISISDALTVRSDDVEDQEEEVEVVPADDVSSSDDADDASSVSSADDEEVEKKPSVVAPAPASAPAPAPTSSSSSSSSKVVYRPTVHYAYMPCDDAILSLREMAGNNFTEPAEKRLIVDDVVGGKDELGVLLLGHAKGAYWYGSQLDVLRARELVPHNSATTLQVTSTILGGMVWALNNPTAGVVEADDIMDFDALLDIAKPYCEPVVGVYSDWTPLKDRHVDLFPDDVDHTDPFQFKNIIV